MAQTFIDFMSCLHSYCDALIPCTFLQLQLSFFNVHCSWQLLRLINLELHPFYQIDLSAFQSPKSKRKKKKNFYQKTNDSDDVHCMWNNKYFKKIQ